MSGNVLHRAGLAQPAVQMRGPRAGKRRANGGDTVLLTARSVRRGCADPGHGVCGNGRVRGAQTLHRTSRGQGMSNHRVFAYPFASVYPLYVQKATRKGRTQEEVDRVIRWLTGYDQAGLRRQIELKTTLEEFFAQAPAINPNSSLIKGVICGVRVEEIEDPLMRRIRQMDKLVDELAKGKALEKVLRQ